VSYLVHRKEPRVYSSKVLRKGDALDPSVLTLRDEDSTFAQGQGFSSLEEVSGKRARAYIPAGKAVTADLVELPPLIRRGDIVRLLVKSGGIVIETQGKALRDARKGETLPLELDNNKKQVQARCVDVGVAVREAY
jgi:flagella basal body P-ring formation protein FlgA